MKPGYLVDLLTKAGHQGKKTGQDEWAFLCVFHSEKTPSLNVSFSKNAFKCWGCGAEGGINEMCEKLGVPSPFEKKRRDEPEDWQSCAEALWRPDGEEGIRILEARGLRRETLRKHYIGITRHLQGNESGGAFRITVPIFGVDGRFLFCRRYHPEARTKTPDRVVLASDATKYVDKPHEVGHFKYSVSCPKPGCGKPVIFSRDDTGFDVGCPSCGEALQILGRLMKMSWVKGAEATLYGAQALAAMSKAAAEDPEASRRVYICEGEWDRLILEQDGFPAVTGTAGAGTWKDEWTRLFDELDVVIVYDTDRAGETGAAKPSKALRTRGGISALRIVRLPFEPESGWKDVTDWFVKAKRGGEFQRLVDEAEALAIDWKPPEMRDTAGVATGARADIDIARIDDEARAFEKHRRIFEIVRADLTRRGRFLHTREHDSYYFHEPTKRLYQMFDPYFIAFVEKEFMLNSTEKEYAFVKAALASYAINYGDLVDVRQFCYFDGERNVVYITQFDGGVLRIEADGWKIVPNGTESVFFVDNADVSDPWEVKEEMTLADGLAELTRYASDISFDLAHASAETQGSLFLLWVISLFFGSAMQTVPIAAVIGGHGSGKSYAFKRLLKLMYGESSDVTTIKNEDQDAFEAAVVGSHLVVFDNVDSDSAFLNDSLATVATRSLITRRKLYTTLSKTTFRPSCFIGITSRTPHFNRPDIVDRLLIFRTNRRLKFRREPAVTDAQRGRFFGALIPVIRSVLVAITEGKRPDEVNIRMADWSTMAICIGRGIGWDDAKIDSIIGSSESRRKEFLSEESPLVEIVQQWLADNYSREDRAYTASELAKDWNAYLDQGSRFKYNRRNVPRMIEEYRPALEQHWHVAVDFDPDHKVRKYRFKSRDANDAAAAPTSIFGNGNGSNGHGGSNGAAGGAGADDAEHASGAGSGAPTDDQNPPAGGENTPTPQAPDVPSDIPAVDPDLDWE